MSTDRIWHKGPPPHVGWWMVRFTDGFPEKWGWWDGEWWSTFCDEQTHARDAAACANERGHAGPETIQWTDYYPENARVPRVDPRIHQQNLRHDRDRMTIEYRALMLLQEAGRLGFNVTIENQPLQPLAMGNTRPVVNVWPKRSAA